MCAGVKEARLRKSGLSRILHLALSHFARATACQHRARTRPHPLAGLGTSPQLASVSPYSPAILYVLTNPSIADAAAHETGGMDRR
jgi:hypothetical protein